jgi:Mg/Co/Ni transporter MgtE
MTTEFIAVPDTGTVADAIEALRQFEGSSEAVATIYLTGPGHVLSGAVPLVRIAISPSDMNLKSVADQPTTCPPDTPDREVAELFDKYNLITLAVADEHGRLSGIITADDVISMLRNH